MEEQKADFVTLGQILSKIRRHKWLLISCVLLSLLSALIYNHMATPTYRASAMVSFEQYSNDNMLDLDFANSRYKASYIANRVKEIKTWTFAQHVFRALPDSIRQLFRQPDLQPADLNTERYMITRIQAGISVLHTEATPNILTISFNSQNAELAKLLTNTVNEVLKNTTLAHRRREFTSLRQFIEEQIKITKKKLDKSEKALSQFKTSDSITSLQDESREILRRVTQAEILYNEIKTEKRAKERKLSVIQEKIDEQKENIGNTLPEDASPTIARLKEQLVNLEVQEANFKVQGYREDHPALIEIHDEILGTKQNLLELTKEVINDQNLNRLVDPLARLKEYLEESIAIEIEIQGLAAQQSQLQETLEAYDTRIKNLSAKDGVLFGLLRDRDVNNKLYVRLVEEREQAQLREAAEIGPIRIMEEAQLPLSPYSPRKKLNIVIALLASTIIGFLFIIMTLLNKPVPQTYEEVEELLELPVLASVPIIKSNWKDSLNGIPRTKGYLTPFYQDAYTSLWHAIQVYQDAYTSLSNSIQGLGRVKKGKNSPVQGLGRVKKGRINSVMITSASPGEGKSTTSLYLAITAAKLGQKVLLIEGDFRKPSLAELLNVSDSNDLSNLVTEGIESVNLHVVNDSRFSNDDCAMQMDLWELVTETQDIDLAGLRFLSASSLPKTPGLVWASPQIKKALSRLMKDYDFTIIDAPPLLGIPDAVSISTLVDGIVMCVAVEQTGSKFMLRARRILRQTNKNILGIVWNKVDPLDIYGKYKYRKYYQTSFSKE